MCLQVRLRVPEISVAMDAKEFEILQDVASHLAGEQVHILQNLLPCLRTICKSISNCLLCHYGPPLLAQLLLKWLLNWSCSSCARMRVLP